MTTCVPSRSANGTDESYSYDSNGNRTCATAGSSSSAYITGDHNRLLSDGTYTYDYDAEGNRTRRTNIATGAVTEYAWDHRNRLVEVIDRASADGPALQTVQYVYDTRNRWIAKTLDPDGDRGQKPTTTHFVYDSTQIILQVDGDGDVRNRYLWGPDVDQLLADEQLPSPAGGRGAGGEGGGHNQPGEVFWPLTDHLNTVRDLAEYNPESGQTTISNQLTYDAFGQILTQTNPAVTTLFAFTARPFDPDTSLQNNLHRWYDATIGRWLSEDPIGFAAADASMYRYVGNMATNATDPTGSILQQIIAEALKTAMEAYHDEHGGHVLKEVPAREANRAVKRIIDLNIASKVTPPSTNFRGKTGVKDVPLKNGEVLRAARLLAGTLGFDTRVNDEELAHIKKLSDEGKLIVQIGGKDVTVGILSSGDRGEITYFAIKEGETVTAIHWVYRYFVWFLIQPEGSGEPVRVEFEKFVTTAIWPPDWRGEK